MLSFSIRSLRALNKLIPTVSMSSVAEHSPEEPKSSTQNGYSTIEALMESDDLNSDQKKALTLCREEYEMARYIDPRFPEEVSQNDWLKLIELKSIRDRMNFFLYVMEKAKKNMKRTKKMESTEDSDRGFDVRKSILIHTRPATMKHCLDSFASHHPVATGQPTIVMDMSYFDHMSPFDNSMVAKHLNTAYDVNRVSRYPCRMIYSDLPIHNEYFRKKLNHELFFIKPYVSEPEAYGFRDDSTRKHAHNSGREVSRNMKKSNSKHLNVFHDTPIELQDPRMNSRQRLSIFATPGKYENMFPREKIVQITQRAVKPLLTLDEDRVYVLPAMIDSANSAASAIAKGKELGVEQCYIPYDRYIKWSTGHKRLPVNLLLSILLDVFNDGDWESAMLAHVPKRKLRPSKPAGKFSGDRKRDHVEWLVSELSR